MTEALLYCLGKQAAEIGPRSALRHRTVALTYAELHAKVQDIRALVSKCGPPPWHPVFLNVTDGNWCSAMVGYLGVVTAGRVALLSRSKPASINAPTLSIALEAGRIELNLAGSAQVSQALTGFEPDGLALDIVFTSGSTGKAVPFLFEHAHFIDRDRIRSPTQELRAAHVAVPFHTSTGVHGIALRHLLGGVSSIALDAMPNWHALATVFNELRPLELGMTSFELERMLRGGDDVDPISSVRYLRLYAGPVSDQLRDKAQLLVPNCRITSIYGLTEAGSATMTRNSGSTGFNEVPGEARFGIWDVAADTLAKDGETGEIVIKAIRGGRPPIPLDVAEASDAMPDGWIGTGDLGYRREDGTIAYWGRAKEIVVVDGERQHSPTLEERLVRAAPFLNSAMFFNFANGGCERLGLIVETRAVDEVAGLAALVRVAEPLDIVIMDKLLRTDLGKIARLQNAKAAATVLATTSPVSMATAPSSAGMITIFDGRVCAARPRRRRTE